MSQRYTDEQQEHAIQALRENLGDVPLVSQLLGIPERTLYNWRKRHLQQEQNPLPPPLPPQQTPNPFGIPREELIRQLEAEYIPNEFNELREKLMQHMRRLQISLSEDPDLAHRRVLAISRLLENILKLENMVRINKPQVSIIKYEYMDDTFHDIPDWKNPVYQRADDAYRAVIEEAKREYYAQQKTDNGLQLAADSEAETRASQQPQDDLPLTPFPAASDEYDLFA